MGPSLRWQLWDWKENAQRARKCHVYTLTAQKGQIWDKSLLRQVIGRLPPGLREFWLVSRLSRKLSHIRLLMLLQAKEKAGGREEHPTQLPPLCWQSEEGRLVFKMNQSPKYSQLEMRSWGFDERHFNGEFFTWRNAISACWMNESNDFNFICNICWPS